MANEKRLIDANAFRDWLCKQKRIGGRYLIMMLDETPTVDAVEVVRSKNCKQWSRNSGIAESPNGHCFYHCIDTNGHDFCSYGERKGNDNERKAD